MKDAVQAIAADMRAAMIEELRVGLCAETVPTHAMTFEELYETSGATGRDRLRAFLNKRIQSGEWKRQRIGLTVKYWKVE